MKKKKERKVKRENLSTFPSSGEIMAIWEGNQNFTNFIIDFKVLKIKIFILNFLKVKNS